MRADFCKMFVNGPDKINVDLNQKYLIAYILCLFNIAKLVLG